MSGIFQNHPPKPSSAKIPVAPKPCADNRLRLALELSRLGTWSYDPATGRVQCDAQILAILGEPVGQSGDLVLASLLRRIHTDDRRAVEASLRAALRPDSDGSFAATCRIRTPGGGTRWIATIGQARFEPGGRRVLEWVGTARDSTDENRTSRLLVAQKELLERIVRGEPLEAVLEAIVQVIGEQSGGSAVASIMLLDPAANCLRVGTRSGLAEHYLAAIDGIPVIAGLGTCPAAAASNEPVFTPDLASDPSWNGKSHLAIAEGLLAAWSLPIRASDGRVLGTLGTYFREPRLPDEREMQVVGVLVETAALAIEKLAYCERLDEATAEIVRRQRLYEAVASNTPDLIYVFDLEHRFTYANHALLELWGMTWEQAIGKTCLELGYEKWHAEMHDREIDDVVRSKVAVRGEMPFRGKGSDRTFEYIFTPVFGPDGNVEAVSGVTRDVTDRKWSEERAHFLAQLTRRLALINDEQELVRTAVEAVGSFLNCHRCYFVECFDAEDKIVVGPNWLRDESAFDISGEKNLFHFGGLDWWKRFCAGNFAVADVAEEPLTRRNADRYMALGIRSYAVQPYRRDGRVTVVLSVTENVPRSWSVDELTLVESVIARAWPLVERIRSEADLRKSEEHLRLIANQIPALVSYVDAGCRYRFVNDHYRKWFNIYTDEILGRHAREVLGEEIYRDRLPSIRRVLAGETLTIEGPAHHHLLGSRELEVSLVPDFSEAGEVRGFYVMGFDITEHRRSKETLSRRSERLRLLWESARILLTTDDPDTMLQRLFEQIGGHLGADTYFNFTLAEGGKSLHLRSWHGVEETDAAEIARLGLGTGPCGQVALQRKPIVISDSEGVEGHELRFGTRAYAGYPLIADSQVLGTLAFASRTRDSFTAEELEFIETISHYVTAAYVRLELVANLREAGRRKDEFLATLAHELRNPLAPIRTGIEVLKHSLHQPERIGGVIGIIERQSAQMVRLIDDLIDVSRITRGKIDLRTSIVNLANVLSGAIESVQPLIDRLGHVLENHLPERPVYVEGDAGRLVQVFANLLSNAAKYTPESGRIELRVAATPDSVVVVVKDEGEGIDPEMQHRIFDMFTQVKRPGKSSEGLGIGLTLVRLLVQKHRGSIEVASEGLGKGSEFIVTLPRAIHPEEGVEEPEPELEVAPVAAPARSRILVVDDGVSAADMLALFLKLEGYDSRTAYDGIEALEIASELQPRVVFLDIGMPRMDGYEAARRLRQLPGGQQMILIALTGWGQERDREKTRLAGFDHHLVKPVEPVTLRRLLAQLDLDEPRAVPAQITV